MDLHLLINYPMVWETRLLYFIYFGSIFGICSAFIARFFPLNFPEIPSPRFFFFAGLMMFFVALSILIYYVQDQNRQKKKVFSLKESYALFGLYLINASILFCLPLVLFLLLLGNAQKSIQWEEMDYFDQVMEMYNKQVDEVQLKVYAAEVGKTAAQLSWDRAKNKIDYQRFGEPELRAKAIAELNEWNKGNTAVVAAKLERTIAAVDFTVPTTGKFNYIEALGNEVFNQALADVVPGRYKANGQVSATPENALPAITYLTNAYNNLKELYNRNGNNDGRVTLSIIGLLLLFFSVNWCLLSRGYNYAGTNFISLVFLVLAGYLLLCTSEFLYHTVVHEMEHFNAKLITPFLAFATLIGLTYLRRNNGNNHYLLTLTTLGLIFLVPLFYYNIVSADVDLIWRDSSEWRNVINPISVFLLFILAVVLIVHSLLLYSRFNINPKR